MPVAEKEQAFRAQFITEVQDKADARKSKDGSLSLRAIRTIIEETRTWTMIVEREGNVRIDYTLARC